MVSRRDATVGSFKFGGLAILAIIAVLLFSMLLASMSIFGWGFFQRSTADFRGETEQIERTRADADFRIGSYDWFFDQCASIQAMDGRIDAQLGELNGDPEPDDDRKGQINTNLAAMRGQRSALIAEYNQEARKEDTSGVFRDADLPESINPDIDQVTCTWSDES